MASKSRVRESTADIAEQIKAAVKEQQHEALVAAVDERVHAMKAYAESISPEDSKDPNYPGRYRDSFDISEHDVDGWPGRTLGNHDEIANLVEYGSINNREHAVLGRTAEAFRQ
jgi:hypothetical protein